jgi:CelD/BcsL family acetyltransferase involved in cellulose biosynthesis
MAEEAKVLWTHRGMDGGHTSLIAAVEKRGKLYLMRWLSSDKVDAVASLVENRFRNRAKHLYNYLLEDMRKRQVDFPEEYLERLQQQEALENL